jgi:Ran GTPase-activating protein (RanGAP) involved in mRNA processing and transport
MTDGKERVRLRAREGEAVEWTRRVAQRAGTLKDMMDDAPPEDGVYPVPKIAAAELAVLREMCEADSMPARLEQCSISELFRLVEGASFLDAPGALNHAQHALASRLNGKRADELTELLGATDGFGSAEERVAALAEPAFSPEGQLSEAMVGYAGGAPALQPQLTLWMAVTDDAKEVALGMVDVVTLAELKGVNRSWSALARRVLCSRLSRCEGQPAPTQLAEITDLNIKVLVDAGRPWEAAAAGRMLPSLARLRWEGFEVNVAAVRGVDLDERDDESPFLGGPAETALLSCIEGEGEPPLELLLAAVACAGSGEIRGIPVQMMRDDSVSELDLQERNIGVEDGMLLAYLVPVMGGLTSLNLSSNELCGIDEYGNGTYTAEGITAIADALRVNGGLTSINMSGNDLTDSGRDMTGIRELAAALGVNGALTRIDIRHNKIAGDVAEQLSAAVIGNLKIEMFNEIPIKEMRADSLTELDLNQKYVGVEGGMVVAGLIPVMGGLTALNLSFNDLEDEGVSAVCRAIQSNKETKLASLNVTDNGIGPMGANAVAAMVAVTGGLTSLDLSSNQLCGLDCYGRGTYSAEGITAIADALRNGALTKIDVSWNFFGPEGAKVFADALRVNGALTSINLSDNQLCGVWTDHRQCGHGTYTAEGITAIADALRVNGALTVTNLLGNPLDEASAKMLAEVAKQKGISLCGIRRDQTTADFSKQNLKPPDAILLASDLTQAVVTGGLTSLNLSYNQLCGLDRYHGEGTYTAEGVTAIADAMRVNGALTMLSLAKNRLGEEGTKAICEALEQNQTLKKLDISGGAYGFTIGEYEDNIGGSAGAKHVAKMLVVNGALTSVDLSENHLTNRGRDMTGITAIADALCVNGALTRCDLRSSKEGSYMGEEGEALIRSAVQGKARFELNL